MASERRPKMDRENRAKQFMPFDALKGLREALVQKERIIVPKRELSKDQEEELERKLCRLQRNDVVRAEYFQDGEYVQVTGVVVEIDLTGRELRLVNTRIPFEDLSDLQEEGTLYE